MKSNEIQHNVQCIIDNFSKKKFIYDLLIANGISNESLKQFQDDEYYFVKDYSNINKQNNE